MARHESPRILIAGGGITARLALCQSGIGTGLLGRVSPQAGSGEVP